MHISIVICKASSHEGMAVNKAPPSKTCPILGKGQTAIDISNRVFTHVVPYFCDYLPHLLKDIFVFKVWMNQGEIHIHCHLGHHFGQRIYQSNI